MRSQWRHTALSKGNRLARFGPVSVLRRQDKGRERRQDPVYNLEEYDGPTWVEPPVRRKRKKRLGLREIVYICLLVFLVSSWIWFFLRRHVLKPWIVLGCQSKGIYELWQVPVG